MDGDKQGPDAIGLEIRHLRTVVAIMILLVVPGLLVLGNSDWAQSLSMAYPVGLVGAGAATANNVRRLQRVRHVDADAVDAIDPRLVVAQIYLSPIIGAAFAAVTYGLFLSGILQGEFFPDFACADNRFTDYDTFASCNPTTNGDAAMAMVWGFVAGFAERFVPNILDSIIPKGGK